MSRSDTNFCLVLTQLHKDTNTIPFLLSLSFISTLPIPRAKQRVWKVPFGATIRQHLQVPPIQRPDPSRVPLHGHGKNTYVLTFQQRCFFCKTSAWFLQALAALRLKLLVSC